MKQIAATKIPHIGMRIIKSSIAVFLCFLFYSLFRKNGITFYSQLAALWCMQPLRDNTRSKALQRTIGTFIGAVFGLLVLLIDRGFPLSGWSGELFYAFLVSINIIFVIYTTLLIHKKDASYFSCVVFLSIVVNHIGDANPYLFVLNRVLDTMIGLVIGISVNHFHLPRRKEKDILFVSGMDETLLSPDQKLSAYSLVELNRMLADGANFTVSTKRTPASLLEPLRGVNLKLPVIAMDGAVMYDIRTHEYLHAYVLSMDTVHKLQHFLDGFGINYFMNMILDNMLIIQYKKLQNPAEQDIYDKLHTSPYRNYTTTNLLSESQCVYFMMIEEKERISRIYEALEDTEFRHLIRAVTYDSDDYPGYAYIKIYSKNATRKNMMKYLEQETGLHHIVTFGSIEGQYDILIREYDHNKVVRTLKKMYEPLRWAGRTTDF